MGDKKFFHFFSVIGEYAETHGELTEEIMKEFLILLKESGKECK